MGSESQIAHPRPDSGLPDRVSSIWAKHPRRPHGAHALAHPPISKRRPSPQPSKSPFRTFLMPPLAPPSATTGTTCSASRVILHISHPPPDTRLHLRTSHYPIFISFGERRAESAGADSPNTWIATPLHILKTNGPSGTKDKSGMNGRLANSLPPTSGSPVIQHSVTPPSPHSPSLTPPSRHLSSPTLHHSGS
jgi:hypothetical protein